VEHASAVTVIVSTATSFNGFDADPALHGRDPGPIVLEQTERALSTPWSRLRQEHVADHRALFDRVSLDLSGGPSAELSTDRRIATHGAKDPGLVELLFDYGRYLLIASSRPGTQPANLQGIWNEGVNPPWGGKYTININTEMNYWPAEVCNLSELHTPLFDLIESAREDDRRLAKNLYGARGFVVHHNKRSTKLHE
jgi:alpha-L-fucosidase 2